MYDILLRIIPTADLSAAEADPALTSFLNGSITSGSRGISRSKKVLTADDPRCYDFEMATGSPLTLRREDRLELFFEGRGHGQAFDDHVVQGGAGDRV